MNTQNLQQKKWCIMDNESKGVYPHYDPILTRSLESSLCDYFDAYI